MDCGEDEGEEDMPFDELEFYLAMPQEPNLDIDVRLGQWCAPLVVGLRLASGVRRVWMGSVRPSVARSAHRVHTRSAAATLRTSARMGDVPRHHVVPMSVPPVKRVSAVWQQGWGASCGSWRPGAQRVAPLEAPLGHPALPGHTIALSALTTLSPRTPPPPLPPSHHPRPLR